MIRIDQFINVIHGAVLSANDALRQENLKLLETYFEDTGEYPLTGKEGSENGTPQNLRAKTVALQFPELSEKGVVMRNVQVPLIALVPVSMTKVSEVKFRSNVEIEVENDNLMMNFRSRAPQGESTPGMTSASIEMTITPQESSEGLKNLIEGYEKALRSQIPS
jgi:hypothetical protein